MKKIIFFITATFCIFLVYSCQNPEENQTTETQKTTNINKDDTGENAPAPSVPIINPELEGYTYFNGVLVEKFPPSNMNPNRYNADNKVYKPGRVFVYGYYYESVNQQRLLAQNIPVDSIPMNKAWQFVHMNQVNTLTITDVLFTIQDGLGILGKVRADYNRTTAQVNYSMPAGVGTFKEYVGFIENPMGVWIYPPRTKLFGVLAMNPQPYIKAPYEVGNKWEWSTMVSAAYSDPRWAEWGGQLVCTFNYEIIGKKMVDSPLGQLECYEINAFGENRLGKTQLTSYFHEEYGFVQMNFLNIDGSKLILLLKEVKES